MTPRRILSDKSLLQSPHHTLRHPLLFSESNHNLIDVSSPSQATSETQLPSCMSFPEFPNSHRVKFTS